VRGVLGNFYHIDVLKKEENKPKEEEKSEEKKGQK
jgi:hypothetical protein